MSSTKPPPSTARIIPDQWVKPVDFRRYFPHPDRPLELDLGCGKGRFLLERARTHPEANFIGIDRMLRRIRRLDRKVFNHDLHNIRLLRMEGAYALNYLVPPGSIRTCYYFFPDPWPKARHHENRLFKQQALDALHRILEPGGTVHIATDHLPYLDEMTALLRADPRFQPAHAFFPTEAERTDFELLFREARAIGRCSFSKQPGAA